MDLGIKGRRAIVTGGSSGIGFEPRVSLWKKVCGC